MSVQAESKQGEIEETKIEDPGRILYAVMYTQDSIKERPTLFSE